jgi:hypothetical protein
MHQNVVSAFPAKRLIIKRVGAVVPQEGRMRIRAKKGRRKTWETLKAGGEKRSKLQKRYS